MPMPDEEDGPTAIDILKADITRNMRAFSTTAILDSQDLKKHLADVLWPTLEAFVEAVADQFEAQGATIDEIIEGEEDLIHAELASMIVGTLMEGAELVRQLLLKIPANDKTAATMQLRARAAAYGGAIQETIAAVTDVTIPDDAPQPAEADQDGDEDEDEEEDDHGGR